MTKPKEPKNSPIEFLSFVALFCITSSLPSAWAACRKDLQTGSWTDAGCCGQGWGYRSCARDRGWLRVFAAKSPHGQGLVAPSAAVSRALGLGAGTVMGFSSELNFETGKLKVW